MKVNTPKSNQKDELFKSFDLNLNQGKIHFIYK